MQLTQKTKFSVSSWIESGKPYVWLNAGAVTLSVLMVTGLLLLIATRGLGHFWPHEVVQFDYSEGQEAIPLLGEIKGYEELPKNRLSTQLPIFGEDQQIVSRTLIKTGNRDFVGLDFRWVYDDGKTNKQVPKEVIVVERREWGNFYGFYNGLIEDGKLVPDSEAWDALEDAMDNSTELFEEIRHIEKDLIGGINYKMERLRLKQRGYELEEITDPAPYAKLDEKRAELQKEYNGYTDKLGQLYNDINKTSISASLVDGEQITIPLGRVVRVFQPNNMNFFEKVGFYFSKLWEFFSEEPREANTEGGIFPAIFGTILMVMLMAVIVTPFGVIAAVYLREYATQGPLTRAIRIAVNNLAGVPSVVYGVFGLGFFVYFVGGSIDDLFFRESLPAPTFGTPGLLWASLTLAILTVPVVIVATEEGLSRVPRAIREGSLALGATKAETMWLTVLPMTASSMITGLILAVARAAGEVAPLMLVGVVKLAPSLPLDGNFPFLHMDRKFMHLGFHIYDVGFQSPNVEAARPLVYATALLLVLIIIVLNLTAIRVRNTLREKYRGLEQ